MNPQHTYRELEIDARPVLREGRYWPKIVVTSGSECVVIAPRIQCEGFATESEAVQFAMQYAMDFIDRRGEQLKPASMWIGVQRRATEP